MKDENAIAAIQLDCRKHSGGDLFGEGDETGRRRKVQFSIIVKRVPKDDPQSVSDRWYRFSGDLILLIPQPAQLSGFELHCSVDGRYLYYEYTRCAILSEREGLKTALDWNHSRGQRCADRFTFKSV